MSDRYDDWDGDAERAMAEGDRACAELKAQVARAHSLVRDARSVLQPEVGRSDRSGPDDPFR